MKRPFPGTFALWHEIMKRTFLIIIILCVAAFVALEVYVQTDDFAARIRPLIVGPLQDILGPETKIGFVKTNFFPLFLEVRDIVIPDSQGRAAVAIRKVTIYVNPLPLLFKKIRLPSITILEPRINIEREPDGTFNIEPVVERINANIARTAGGGSSGYRLLLRTLTIRKGELKFRDRGMSSEVDITDLNMIGRFNESGDRIVMAIRGSKIQVSAPSYPVTSGVLKAQTEFNRGRLILHSLEFTTGDSALTVRGAIGSFPAAVMDLKGRIRLGPLTISKFTDIFNHPPRKKGPRIEASVIVTGKFSSPEINSNIKLSGLTYQGTTLKDSSLLMSYENQSLTVSGHDLHISRNDKVLTLDRIVSTLAYRQGVVDIKNIDVAAGDLSLRIGGVFEPSKGFNAHIRAVSSGAGRTIAYVTSLPIEGTIKLEGDVKGPFNALIFKGDAIAGPLLVRGVRFNDIKGKVEYGSGKLTASSVDIRQMSSRYVLDGTISLKEAEPAYTAHLHVIQSDVVSIATLFYKPIPLNILAKGDLSFQGTGKQYSGNIYLSLDRGSAYGESFTHGVISASLNNDKISFPKVVLYKKKGIVKATGWIAFDGTYSANLEGRNIDLSSVDHLNMIPVEGEGLLVIHSSGSFTNPTARASIEIKDLFIRKIPVGHLHGDAEISDGKLKILVLLPDESARLSTVWVLRKPFTWNAEAKMKIEEVKPLSSLGAVEVSERLKVSVDCSITAHGVGLDPSNISGEAVFPNISMDIGDYSIVNESPVVLSIDAGNITIKSLNFAGLGTRISVAGMAKNFTYLDISLTGTAELSLLKLIIPAVEHAGGNATVKLTVKDSWKNPDVIGELQIQEGEIKIRDIPQKFTGLNGRITFTQGKVTTDSLSGEIGGGKLQISGWAQLSGTELLEFTTKTTVSDVTVRYPEGLTSTLSGVLYFDGDAKERTFSGDVLIKRAKYDKRIEWKSMLVDIGRGLYQKKKTSIGWIGDTQINIRFHGSDNILFENNLARIPLDIDVFLRGTVDHPQLLGRIEARTGTVYFRNNEFKILQASVDFVDPTRMNPILDIQAETQVREYQIRLAVTGAADKAAVTLISDPALSDTDILSLLALGKTSSQLQGSEKSVGVGEATSFATGQFQDIFERQARSLTGLDRFQVDPYVGQSNTSVPRLTVGKELLQNKLYATYSSNVGASSSEQIFKLEYILNKHFSLVGDIDQEMGNSGADIKYRFEFK
jgi:translocation and assembly module TamB